jgi:heat shock protein HtpX
MFWGRDRRGAGNTIVTIVMIILVPFAAMLLQLSISRTREFLADESGAKISQSPLALASALEKIHGSVASTGKKAEDYSQEATASLFICSPFKSKGDFFFKLLSTHPPVEKRVKALQQMHFDLL